MCVDICIRMCINMCMNIYVGMCTGMRTNMCIGMHIGMCRDMCIGLRVGMCVGMCIDMLWRPRELLLAGWRFWQIAQLAPEQQEGGSRSCSRGCRLSLGLASSAQHDQGDGPVSSLGRLSMGTEQ